VGFKKFIRGFHTSSPPPLQGRHPDRALPNHGGLPCISLRYTNWVAAHWAGHQERLPLPRAAHGLASIP
jgi:hypothetical protein